MARARRNMNGDRRDVPTMATSGCFTALARVPDGTERSINATLWLSSALLVLMAATPAYAESREDATAEIIVTAQKRSENIQTVPIAITALNGAALERRSVNNPQALQYVAPGLVFTDNPTGVGMVTVRGVGGSGSRGSSPGQNPAVPVHANGVYLQSPAVMLQDFLDIERVEVLRGPQGTLYGRNAVGGSINIITNRPTDAVQGYVSFEIGNYDKRRLEAVVSGPLNNRLRARLAFALEDRDGFVKNVADPSDDKLLNSDYSNLRATVEYDLTSEARITVIGYRYEKNGASYTLRPTSLPPVGIMPLSSYNLVPPGYQLVTFSDSRKVQHDTQGDGRDKTGGLSGEINWNPGSVSLRSITSYFDMSTANSGDNDGTDLPQVHGVSDFFQRYKSFSQEFQLASGTQSPLQWLAGAYYYRQRASGGIVSDSSSPLNLIPFLINVNGQFKARSLAAFSQVDYELLEGLTLTGGLRYTSDKMEASRSFIFNAPIYVNVKADDSWHKVTWKLGAKYQLSGRAMAYASYSRGYKAGGFNLSDSGPAYNPEIVDAYEVGFKSDLVDRLLSLNGSVFYYDYKDKQELSTDATGFSVIENAGAATLYGAELEFVSRPASGFSLDGSVSYLHSRYDRYSTLDLENSDRGVQDLKGRQLTEAPKWQIHLGAQYSVPLVAASGALSLRVDYSYTDSRYVRPFNLPTDRMEAYGRTSARLWWESDNKDWLAELYVDNIENKDIVTSFASTSPYTGNIHQDVYLNPRTYGLKVTRKF